MQFQEKVETVTVTPEAAADLLGQTLAATKHPPKTREEELAEAGYAILTPPPGGHFEIGVNVYWVKGEDDDSELPWLVHYFTAAGDYISYEEYTEVEFLDKVVGLCGTHSGCGGTSRSARMKTTGRVAVK